MLPPLPSTLTPNDVCDMRAGAESASRGSIVHRPEAVSRRLLGLGQDLL